MSSLARLTFIFRGSTGRSSLAMGKTARFHRGDVISRKASRLAPAVSAEFSAPALSVSLSPGSLRRSP
jgi:hypothetical protein